MLNRREFIKLFSVASSIVFAPTRGIGRSENKDFAFNNAPAGELYEGFLILEEESPIPEFVQFPTISMPDGCGIGVDEKSPKPRPISKFFESPQNLAQEALFRVYLPEKVPNGLRPGKSYTLSNSNGLLYEASLAFEAHNSDAQLWETVASFWIQLQYPKPLPLQLTKPVDVDVPGVTFDKVDFLPSPGLQMVTEAGFVYYWIESDIFYALILEPCPNEETAREFIGSLAPTR
jgi:hypothetical protein